MDNRFVKGLKGLKKIKVKIQDFLPKLRTMHDYLSWVEDPDVQNFEINQKLLTSVELEYLKKLPNNLQNTLNYTKRTLIKITVKNLIYLYFFAIFLPGIPGNESQILYAFKNGKSPERLMTSGKCLPRAPCGWVGRHPKDISHYCVTLSGEIRCSSYLKFPNWQISRDRSWPRILYGITGVSSP